MTHQASAEELRRALVAVGRNRDRTAYIELFNHFAPRLKAYFRRLGATDGAAEDLAQETMLVVWNKAELFDPSRAGAGTWVFTVARNLRIDQVRRDRLVPIGDGLAVGVEAPEQAEHPVSAAEETERLRAALATLPPEQELLVRLAFFGDRSHAQLGQELLLPLGTVKARLRRALARLRVLLGDES